MGAGQQGTNDVNYASVLEFCVVTLAGVQFSEEQRDGLADCDKSLATDEEGINNWREEGVRRMESGADIVRGSKAARNTHARTHTHTHTQGWDGLARIVQPGVELHLLRWLRRVQFALCRHQQRA